ncbi:MAG: cytochrome d ubiquinol oxidase subunit II [Deltaproteobacteria bacterium]|nr:cytochrome d ubiquinol oxidase subunit II [Deltaproteobacteria bacterium]
MPDLATLSAAAILVSLVIYALTGGADFGGGAWDLLAWGARRREQKLLVAHAIGPIWETNHIWLVIAVVVLFTAFPRAFAALSTALFVPLSLVLAGIVLRGAAFAFHAYHLESEERRSRWGTLFAGTSLATPLFLGIAAGAAVSGSVPALTDRGPAPIEAWLAPFPLAVGLFALSLFCYLAAVYLVLETTDPGLRSDFRIRAVWSARVVALLAVTVALLAGRGAPAFREALLESPWSTPVMICAAAMAIGAYTALHLHVDPLARSCAAAQVAFIVLGWGLAQNPFLVRPDLTIAAAAAPPATLRPLLAALLAGAVVLFPAIFVLLRTFKREALFSGSPRRKD